MRFLARRGSVASAATVIASSGFASGLVARLGVPAGAQYRTRLSGGRCWPGLATDVDAGRRASGHVAASRPNPTSLGRTTSATQRARLVIGALALLRAEFPTLQVCDRWRRTGARPARGSLVHERRPGTARLLLSARCRTINCPGLYAACDIFLMPTRQDGPDVEGFGIVFLEAAASERPSIGGRNGGVPEAIAEGETGLLVEGHDSGELAQAIRTLASSPTLRATMGAAGQRRVLQSFTWDRAARQVETLHRELSGATLGRAE